MNRFLSLLAVGAITAFATISYGQVGRDFQAHSLILDDNASPTPHRYTIQTPPGMTGDLIFNLPIPPSFDAVSGFVYPGDTTGNLLQWTADAYRTGNGAWVPVSLSSVLGSGNENYLAKWNAGGQLQNSQLFDNGEGVSIGGNSPAALFNVGSTNQFQVDGSGNVLASKLTLSGTAAASDSNEVFFSDNGQIRSYDNNHRLIFDRSNNLFEIREAGDIMLSPGAVEGSTDYVHISSENTTFHQNVVIGDEFSSGTFVKPAEKPGEPHVNLYFPDSSGTIATVGYVSGSYLPLSGGTMNGAINMGVHDLYNVQGLNAIGTIQFNALPLGVVHSYAGGVLYSSRILNADIDDTANIADTKLATITSAGKVANSATTATADNVPGTIVLRDDAGHFAASNATFDSLTLRGATSGELRLQAAATTTADQTLILPDTNGGANTYLMNDGTGKLSWSPASGGGVTGSGTPLFVPMWTGTSELSNSPIEMDETSGVVINHTGSNELEAGLTLRDFYFDGTPSPGYGISLNYDLSAGFGLPVRASSISTEWSTIGQESQAADIVFRNLRNGELFEAMRIDGNGHVGVGDHLIKHQLDVRQSEDVDEFAAVLGRSLATTSNQSIGVWGDAHGNNISNTGTIGVLATGSGRNVAGETNIALQVNDGEFTMGRTTQTNTDYTVIDPASGGTAYDADGPSGVVQINASTLNFNPNNNITSNQTRLATFTLKNRYLKPESIILLSVNGKNDTGEGVNINQCAFTLNVRDRSTGNCTVEVFVTGRQNMTLSGNPFDEGDSFNVGYMVVNPSR